MGTGKLLPTFVILSISVMMVFSILPAYAEHQTSTLGCGGGPWALLSTHDTEKDVPPEILDGKDRNKNGWVCFFESPSLKKIVRDDRA